MFAALHARYVDDGSGEDKGSKLTGQAIARGQTRVVRFLQLWLTAYPRDFKADKVRSMNDADGDGDETQPPFVAMAPTSTCPFSRHPVPPSLGNQSATRLARPLCLQELTRAVAGFLDVVHAMPDRRDQLEAVATGRGDMVVMQPHAGTPRMTGHAPHARPLLPLAAAASCC